MILFGIEVGFISWLVGFIMGAYIATQVHNTTAERHMRKYHP